MSFQLIRRTLCVFAVALSVTGLMIAPTWATASQPPRAAAPAAVAGQHKILPVPVSSTHWQQLHSFAPPTVSPSKIQQQSKSTAVAVAHLAQQLYAVAGVPGAKPAVDGQIGTEADGSVEVTVTGSAAAAASRAAGARIIAEQDGEVTATLTPSKLRTLAASSGVSAVEPARRAYSQGVTAQSVHSSLADTWQAGGKTGAGAVVAVVDGGFANLDVEVAAGNLPVGTTVRGNHCADVNNDAHGTAVAEIVHQMAPGATLLLYCIDDAVGLAQAGRELQAAGAKIVSCSLGFTPDARGDGTGTATPAYSSADTTVRRARTAGILWINSAGNSAQDHWAGTFADRNSDGWSDLNTTTDNYDQVLLPSGASTELALSWDQWPTSSLAVNLRVDVVDASTGAALGYGIGSRESEIGNGPVRLLPVTNNTASDVILDIRVSVPKNVAAVHYDLSYLGDVSNSYYSSRYPARAASGSVTEPASSPYALSVGAAYWRTGLLESFSSRGPTLDGRVKPDLIGFDGVSSNLTAENPFYGTSAAAPNVAGAAALIESVNPSMDAAQIEALLEKRASRASNPPTNSLGHGILNLGPTTGVAPEAGTLFKPITPTRVLDTRTGLGGHRGALGKAGAIFVNPSSRVPANATAVVINLTGTGQGAGSYLSVYPSVYPGTSNLNLGPSDPTAAVSATVALNISHRFVVRNGGGATHVVIDVVGYYAPTGSGYSAVAPFRALDTRTSLGSHHAQVRGREIVRVTLSRYAQIPANATAVAINLTATNMRAPGYVSTGAAGFSGTSSLNYAKYIRANFAIVGLSGRSFLLRNSGSPVDLVVDVLGYYSPTAPGKFHVLPSPVRLADTRTGNGGRQAPLLNTGQLPLFAGGLYGVAYSATAVAVGVVAVATGNGYLSVFARGQALPKASTLNYSTSRVVPNAAITGLGVGSLSIADAGSRSVNVAVDEIGYFSAE